VRGVAAGARRLKNRYGSTLEVLSHVQLWYVEKETRELVRIQQAEPLESFHKAQSDYGLSTGLAVVSEVSELVLPEHEVSETMFRLILLVTRKSSAPATGICRSVISPFGPCGSAVGCRVRSLRPRALRHSVQSRRFMTGSNPVFSAGSAVVPG